jgi:aminomethyltransferase
MLRPEGGIIDDLIATFIDERWFRLVVNAGTADKDIAWIKEHAKPVGVATVPRRDLAIIAVQGPNARAKATPLLPESCRAAAGALGPFFGAACDEWFVSRTATPARTASRSRCPLESAADSGKRWSPPGVALRSARATRPARGELYGNDMDESVTPLESGPPDGGLTQSRFRRQGRAAAQRRGDARTSPGLCC